MTLQEALRWIEGVFEEAAGSLTPETLREDVPLWDSMGVLALMAVMDEQFGVVMSDDDVITMQRIGDILAVLRKHGKLEESP